MNFLSFNFRLIPVCLSLLSLFAATCLAIQTRKIERHTYQQDDRTLLVHHEYRTNDNPDNGAANQEPSNSPRSSRRFVSKTFIDPGVLQDLQKQQRAMSRKKPPLFGSSKFGPIVPYGTNSRTTPRPKVMPKEAKKPSAPPKTVSSPFAKFSSVVPTSAAANLLQVQAEQNFRQGDYSLAAYLADQAMGIDHKNGHLKMFASLANLATGKYETSGQLFRSAAKLLSVGEWHEVFTNAELLYGNNNFKKHLDQLDTYCNEKPFSVTARRLRGFHSLLKGDFETAKSDFEFVLSNDPTDSVTNKLFDLLQTPKPAKDSSTPPSASGTSQRVQRIVNPMTGSQENTNDKN